MDKKEKSLIEKARKDETIMEICHTEYLSDYGKPPPEDWIPSDDEVLEVAIRAGFNLEEENLVDKPIPTIILGGNIKNKYIFVDTKKGEVIFEFQETDEDAAIAYVFKRYNHPPAHYNLYQVEIDTDEKSNFQKTAKIIDLPTEITEDGDYIFS